ncbi:hypothetical protein ES703_20485 [subsurface metagenome]
MIWVNTNYIYISDTKIDMLLPQISYKTKKKIANELKIDFKILTRRSRNQKSS